MATPKETQDFVTRMEIVFGITISGGLFNGMKKLTTTDHKLLEDYVGKVAAAFRSGGQE